MNKRISSIPVTKTSKIQKLVKDYLEGSPILQDLYQLKPSLDSFAQALIYRKDFPAERREVLHQSLMKQYTQANLLNESVKQIIDSTLLPNTFTVTTGQQTGILLGPLYTVMKICSTISLAKKLKMEHPENNFIPVFWMATEDHDIEEIQSVYVQGKKYTWNTDQKGPAGRLSNQGIPELMNEIFRKDLRNDEEKYFIEIIQEAYSMNNLSEATRFLVHHLFLDDDLLIIDADQPELKRMFSYVIRKDIFEEISRKESAKAIAKLEKNYKVQVQGRDINFFYLKDGYRERIERVENGFQTADGLNSFTEESISEEIDSHPERFSPNVMMRPAYQEFILPNLAYFGGGAEISYWLELKPVFDAFQIPFPVLLLRNSAMILDRKNHHRFINNKLEVSDLFLSLDILEKRYAIQQSSEDIELKEEIELLKLWIQRLKKKGSSINQNLERSAEALGTRFLSQTNRYSLKLIREAKRKARVHEDRIVDLFAYVYPEGKLQERRESVFTYLFQIGPEILNDLKNEDHPLGDSFVILFY